jgi:hypothetical protein
MVSRGDWLMISVLFFCLPVKLKLWGEVALPDHAGWSEILVSPIGLPFSCSCLVISSPSEVGQFWFGCYPLVQEIIFVVHYLPSFRGGFLLCFFTGISTLGVYSLPGPFLWGRYTVLSAPSSFSVLQQFALYFLFCGAVWLWVLLTASGDELCDLLPALLWGVTYHLPALCLPGFPVFVYW